jgi:hypothetical protein
VFGKLSGHHLQRERDVIRSSWTSYGVVLLSTILGAPAARAAELAWDNASQAVYDNGLQMLDNGGAGFGFWVIRSTNGKTGVGSSTGNGDAVAPAGDIDSAGGRAWWVSSGKTDFGGAEAVRPLKGSLAVGQHVSFDVDGICTAPNSDVFVVTLGNASEPRWGMTVHESGTHATDGQTPAGTRVAFDTREGMHVDVMLTGVDTFTASVQVLDGSAPVVLSGALDGAAGSAIDRISFRVEPSIGPVDAFDFNDLAVTPEPGVGGMVLVAGGVLMRRGRGRIHLGDNEGAEGRGSKAD